MNDVELRELCEPRCVFGFAKYFSVLVVFTTKM